MRKILIGFGVAALALGLVGCGSGSSKSTSDTTVHVAEPVGATPSASAKMVCEDEAQEDIATAIGVKPTHVTPGTWVNHVYSCKYVYPNGSFTLSVKELSSKQETTDYFEQLQRTLGQGDTTAPDLGQGAFATPNGSLVVRKDYKVLTVDVSQLPAQFGSPPSERGPVALSVGTAIMGCWSGV